MYDARVASGDMFADMFFAVYALNGRAVLLSSLPMISAGRPSKAGSCRWMNTPPTDSIAIAAHEPIPITRPEEPDLWLCRFGSTLITVDDYEPLLADGYIHECHPGDTVRVICEQWLAARNGQRKERKLARQRAKRAMWNTRARDSV
jgi:hypothetical protein